MKILIIFLIAVILFVDCKDRKRNRPKTEDREEDDEFSNSSSDEDWTFEANEFSGRDWYRKRFRDRMNDKDQKYTKLKLDRKMFYYWDSVYESWTNWTSCDPTTCLSTRNRKCKDNSWEEKVRDFRVEMKCPVQYVYERKACHDVKQCKLGYSGDNSTTSLPKICGNRPQYIQTKIIGGRDTIRNTWPWHAGLYVIGPYRKPIYICGATLINPGWVITAGHCLRTLKSINSLPLGEMIDTRKNNLYNRFQLVFGDYDRSEKERSEIITKISHFIIHPNFRADYTSNLYDVALLKLDKIIVPQRHINFACVPESINYTLPETAQCYAIGWGYITSQDPLNIWSLEFNWLFEKNRKRRLQKSRRNSNILQEVEIPLVDFKYCQRIYKLFNLQKEIHLCAGSANRDTCRGDSGGGLFCLDPKSNAWQLYGITNFGSARGCGSSFGVYVRVAALTNWIRDILETKFV